MTTATSKITVLTAPNQSVDVDGRTLAYRTFGTGPNLVLCIRLRGIMDMFVTTWPETGLGPHRQYPAMSADLIASFVTHIPPPEIPPRNELHHGYFDHH